MHLVPYLLIPLFCWAGSGSDEATVVVEATDYSPIGEGMKFGALVLLGCVIIYALVKLFHTEEK